MARKPALYKIDRNSHINILVSEVEKAYVIKQAHDRGYNISQYIRDLIFKNPVSFKKFKDEYESRD